MNKEQFYDYILEHYSISGEAARLINNILDYADGMTVLQQQKFLIKMLDGTIGLSEKEINEVHY